MKNLKTFVQELDEAGRCWTGYKPVKGKKPYSQGSCVKEGVMSQYPELGPATGVSSDQVKADQKRTDRAKEWNRKETEKQEKNVPSSSAKVPSPDEGPVTKKLKEEEQLDEKMITVRNTRSGARRMVSSVFKKIYKKQGWNAVQGTRR